MQPQWKEDLNLPMYSINQIDQLTPAVTQDTVMMKVSKLG